MPANRNDSLLEDLLKIEYQLAMDETKPYETLQQRDRKIGVELRQLKHKPVKQIRAWQYLTGETAFATQDIRRCNVFITSALLLTGLISGISAGLALFFYTGEQPINIVNVLAVGVGLQVVLLLFYVLTALFDSNWIQNLLAGLNAGRWIARLAYAFPSLKSSLDQIFARPHSFANHKIVKWQTIYWSQLFAMSFNLALLFSGLYLVTFSDLAFGWSTTLNFDAQVIKSATDVLAWPWKSFFPAAVPDLPLIESTRFYRLKSPSIGTAADIIDQAKIAGGWWQFLLLALFTYGVLPRLITLLMARHHFNHSVSNAIMSLPGLQLLLDRMNNPAISTISDTREIISATNTDTTPTAVTSLTNRPAYCLHFGEPAFDSHLIAQWITNTTGAEVIDFALLNINEANKLPGSDALSSERSQTAIALIVKAWEPPTLELTDWLHDVRHQFGEQQLITVIAYDINAEKQIHTADSTAIETWRNFLKRQKLFSVELQGVRA